MILIYDLHRIFLCDGVHSYLGSGSFFEQLRIALDSLNKTHKPHYLVRHALGFAKDPEVPIGFLRGHPKKKITSKRPFKIDQTQPLSLVRLSEYQ